jgi:hypothetical protein
VKPSETSTLIFFDTSEHLNCEQWHKKVNDADHKRLEVFFALAVRRRVHSHLALPSSVGVWVEEGLQRRRSCADCNTRTKTQRP